MKKKALTILQYIFFFGLGIFLVWWSIRDLDKNDIEKIKESLKNARYYLIFPVLAILIISHYIRALRWKLLIEPLGYPVRGFNAFLAVMIGYLTNLAFPRLGEVVKCTALARYEKAPVDKLIGTVILERIIDTLCLLVIFGITLAIQPGIYQQIIDTFFHSSGGQKADKSSLLLFLVVIGAIVLIAVAAWMLIKKKSFKDLIQMIKKIIRSVWEGITTIRHLKKRMKFLVFTIIIWICYFSCGYIGFFALRETTQYGIREAFTVLSAGSIGVIVTPGGIGAYPIIIEKTMQLYGLQKGIALAFGWLLWLVQTLILLAGGFFSFVAMTYYNKKRPVEKS